MQHIEENKTGGELAKSNPGEVQPKFRLRFSILALLIFTALVAAYFASRDTDLLSLSMNGNNILPLPVDSYPDVPGRWELVNPNELPLDRILYRQCREFESLPATDRAAVRRSISKPMENTLWEFARRSSVFALRDEDPDRIRAGLVAMSMLPNRHDFRDVYMTLGQLRGATDEFGLGYEVFAEIAEICIPGTSRYNMGVMLKEMTGRDPSSTKSKNFVETEYGIGYVRSGRGPYDQNGDLLSTAMRIANAIEETDPGYRANSFKIGQKTKPTYWFHSHDLDNAAIQNELKSAVQFRATIDPKVAKNQRFVIDVYEFKSTEIVERLQAVANEQEMVDRTAILAVSHENIVCIIGTRTDLADGETNESNQSLKRFLPSFNTAIAK